LNCHDDDDDIDDEDVTIITIPVSECVAADGIAHELPRCGVRGVCGG
jgi:hypothetical protein